MFSHVKRWRALWLGVALAALAIGCTSTSLVDLWKNPDYPRRPLQRLLVVTVGKEPASRRIWEDGFVAELRHHGVDAVASYQLFPKADPDTAELLTAVRRRGFDGVLMAHRQSVTNEATWVPGYVTVRPARLAGPWLRHYAMYYYRAYAPGYVEVNRVVRYEIDVWMTGGDGQLVWSATTASLNPASSKQVNREIADQIVPQLLRTGVVATQ